MAQLCEQRWRSRVPRVALLPWSTAKLRRRRQRCNRRANNSTRIVEKSPQKFNMPTHVEALNVECEPAPEIQLKELDKAAVNQRVSVSVKVVFVEDAVKVTSRAGKELV